MRSSRVPAFRLDTHRSPFRSWRYAAHVLFFHVVSYYETHCISRCSRLEHANHLNVNLAFCLSNNQARFENQPTFANFSKLTLCVYCNALFPHHPQTALSFTFVYTFITRDFYKRALVSLREKTFSITFQLASPSPCQFSKVG